MPGGEFSMPDFVAVTHAYGGYSADAQGISKRKLSVCLTYLLRQVKLRPY